MANQNIHDPPGHPSGVYVDHPLIKKEAVEERDYQRALADACLRSSTLVVLPTGMGKTVVGLLVIADVLAKQKGKALLLAPTKPLVEQHSLFLSDMLVGKKVAVLTGEVDPEEREAEWIQADVIASTPQVVANDLRTERVSLKDVKLIIFDEAHRGVGNYAYVPIAQEYSGLVLGMTASPGSSMAKIKEVCGNLGIESIEVRSEADADVSKYVHDISMDWVEVGMPPSLVKLAAILRRMHEKSIKELQDLGALPKGAPASIKRLLELQNAVQKRLATGEKSRTLYDILSIQARAIKIGHALELAETQGISALTSYIEKLAAEAASPDGSRASRAIVASEGFKEVAALLPNIGMEHPKISRVMSIVSHQIVEKPDSRIMVFTQYRDTCDMVVDHVSRIEGAKVTKLIGQSSRGTDKGLKQKDQLGVLQRFRAGEFNVLVATSVGEEGLDVANTDLVVFYEPVPSEIRSIQRRGRTGRSRAGRVVVMVTAGTRDEASLYSAEKKEKEMRKRLRTLKEQWDREKAVAPKPPKGQTKLGDA